MKLLINLLDHHRSKAMLSFGCLSVVLIVGYQKFKLEGLTIYVSTVLELIRVLITHS